MTLISHLICDEVTLTRSGCFRKIEWMQLRNQQDKMWEVGTAFWMPSWPEETVAQFQFLGMGK